MKIINLDIYNFRGIKESHINFPKKERVICLIGSGDSTKSTILQAIEWLFWPSWNLSVCDSDFNDCKTSAPIILRGTIDELPDKLLSEDKFGLYLRKPFVSLNEGINDEPVDGSPVCLTVQLTIDGSLEPKWEVVCNRNEPKSISPSDRKSILVDKIGANCTKDLMWGKFSVLQKYADSKGVIRDIQTSVLRDVAKKAELHTLDDISDTIKSIGKEYGVGFDNEITSHMQIHNLPLSPAVGLFDGCAPLSQRGLGSQRLLSMGLNVNASSSNSILLIDEIESGLEPYRLRSIINEFRVTHTTSGQVIMTTHSPIAVAECTIDEIMIVHSKKGKTECISLKSEDEIIDMPMQAQIRKNAEAFLSKRIIVCEGKTEQGFIRALDTYLANEEGFRMAFSGIGTADGGGSSAIKCSEQLHSCGYDVCLFMDSDKSCEIEKKNELRDHGITVFDWDESNSIEEQVFNDIPINLATKIVSIAVNERGIESVESCLKNIPYDKYGGCIVLKEMDKTMQRSIGTIAKNKHCGWYKRIDLGEALGNIIFSNIKLIDESSRLRNVIYDIIDWVNNNERK